MRSARLSDVGTASCHRCGRVVGVLRAEVPYSLRVSPSLHWVVDGRECTCPGTRLPRPEALPSSVHQRLRYVVEASGRFKPWEHVVLPDPVHLQV